MCASSTSASSLNLPPAGNRRAFFLEESSSRRSVRAAQRAEGRVRKIPLKALAGKRDAGAGVRGIRGVGRGCRRWREGARGPGQGDGGANSCAENDEAAGDPLIAR